MGFAAPLGLLALLALAIPVLVHLRRKSGRPIRIGTVRYLAGSAPRPRTGPRVTELLLLFLRLALLGFVSVALAEPFVAGESYSRPRSITVTVDSATDLWTMLRELDDTLPGGSSVALAIPARVTVSGARPSVATRVTIAPAAPTQAAAEAPVPTVRRLIVVAPTDRMEAVRHLRAAFGAVAALRGDSLEVSEPGPIAAESLQGAWVVWLAAGVSADSIAAAGASVLAEAPDGTPPGLRIGRTDPGVFARRVGRGILYEVPGRFDSGGSALGRGALPDLVAEIWPGADAAVRAARVTASQLQPARRSDRGRDRRAPLATPLLVAAAIIFVVERILSHRGAGHARVAA
jgi:hypothetical protein